MSNTISPPHPLFPSNSNTKHQAIPLLLLLLSLSPLPLALSQNETVPSTPLPIDQYPSGQKFNPSMAIIMVVLVTSCFLMGFFSVYVRQCTDCRRRRHRRFSPSVGPFAFRMHSLSVARRGLDPSVIESFPTFLYSSVKGHKINKAVSLECAVCLNEFEDEETVCLIPKCCHVFHPDCIGSWLSSQTTCPVCRANLTPKAGEVIIQIPGIDDWSAEDHSQRGHGPGQTEGQPQPPDYKSPQVGLFWGSTVDQESRAEVPQRSTSTGHRMRLVRMFNYFPRSHSTGHSLVRPGEDFERFTLRLPEEVMRNHAVMSRAQSCVAFPRESSLRFGYRTVSNQWTFAVFSGRFGLGRSRRGAELDAESGETASDRMRPNPKGDSQRQRLEF